MSYVESYSNIHLNLWYLVVLVHWIVFLFRGGLEPNDMQIVYRYLVTSLLPAHLETELQGGSMPRHSSTAFATSHYGRYVSCRVHLCWETSSYYVKSLQIMYVGPIIYLFSHHFVQKGMFIFMFWFNVCMYCYLNVPVCLHETRITCRLTCTILDYFVFN